MNKFISTKLHAWKEVCWFLAESRQSFELKDVEKTEHLEFCSDICAVYNYSHRFETPTTAVFQPIPPAGSKNEFGRRPDAARYGSSPFLPGEITSSRRRATKQMMNVLPKLLLHAAQIVSRKPDERDAIIPHFY